MAAQKGKRKTSVQEFYVLDGGAIDLDRSNLTFGHGMGESVRVPTPMYLIKTTEGNVLFDTGWNPQIIPMLSELGLNPAVTEEQSLPVQLEKLGLKPKDIGKVVLSHMHVDHAGGVQFLPDAEIIVQKAEYRYAFNPHSFGALAYNVGDFSFPSHHWSLIDGDRVILPGLAVVLADGHTPGLQALVIDLPDTGVVILASDSCYLAQNIDEEVIPGIVWDPTRALHSITKLKTLARLLGGEVYPNHDIDRWNTVIKKSPDHYT
ncbi:MAG: N-acyl homoserine lactonase family protein [Thermodesulfobacteriota bacterium]